MTSATDNRTTELRDKLDALNIEHFDYDKGGRTQTQWEAPDGKRHFTYETSNNPSKTARLVIAWHPTPEQAIAATLGSDRVTEDGIDKWLREFQLAHGGPDELKDLAFALHNDIPLGYEASMRLGQMLLHATLGGGECEWELEHSGTLYDKWRCSECKFLFVEPRCDQGYMDLVPNYCPDCGRRVKQ